jgi:VanZ family protein
VFVDDRSVEKRRVSTNHGRVLDLSAPLILGADTGGGFRWWGKIKGLAIFGRVLSTEQIARHRDLAREAGVTSLATAEDLIALFPFDEREGDTARNLARGSPDIHIPARFSGLPEALLDFPSFRYLVSMGLYRDALRNILFFVPLGWLLAAAAGRNSNRRRGLVAFVVILAGGMLSFSLEATQLLLPDRVTTPVDVVANTLGTAIGVLTRFALPRLARRL